MVLKALSLSLSLALALALSLSLSADGLRPPLYYRAKATRAHAWLY